MGKGKGKKGKGKQGGEDSSQGQQAQAPAQVPPPQQQQQQQRPANMPSSSQSSQSQDGRGRPAQGPGSGRPQQQPQAQSQAPWGKPAQGPPPGQSQPQGAWGQARGQPGQAGPPQQQSQPPSAQGRPAQGPGQAQQQGAWGQQGQGQPRQPPQQPQPPQQSQPPSAWGKQPAQAPGQPQQPGAWGQQGQGQPRQPPQQSQPPSAQVRPAQGPGQPQQPGAWGQQAQGQPRQPPQQPQPPQQSQPPSAWGKQPAQAPGQPQQPGAWGQQRGQPQAQGAGRGGGRGQGGRNQGQREDRRPGLSSDVSKLSLEDTPKPAAAQTPRAEQRPAPAPSTASAASISSISPPKVTKDADKLSEDKKNSLLKKIPTRKNLKGGGTVGRPIKVQTNMISLIFDKNFTRSATHYDIKFGNDKARFPKFLKKLVFLALQKKHFPKNYPAFDGKVNLYSAGDLPIGDSFSGEVTIFDPERQMERSIEVAMQKVNEIDMTWLTKVAPGFNELDTHLQGMNVLNVVLHSLSYLNSVQVGRSFFSRPDERNRLDLTGGMELYTGLFQSAVLGWKPFFNIDVANKAFPKAIPVIDLIKDLCAGRDGTPQQLTDRDIDYHFNDIQAFLRGLKVIYQIPGKPNTKRTAGVNGLSESARNSKFKLDNGKQITVENYYHAEKNYRLQFPTLPCLWVGPRQRETKVLYPVELCSIAPDLVTNRKLNDEQTRRMIKHCATKPEFRFNKIKNALIAAKPGQNPTMKEFGISLNGNFEQVNARIIPPPSLQYQNKEERVNKGVWRGSQFYDAQNIPEKAWTILNLSRVPEDKLRKLQQDLQSAARDSGMNIGQALTPFGNIQARPNQVVMEVKRFLEQKKRENIKLVIVIISRSPPDAYAKIKQAAELDVGILTQCIKDQTLNRFDRSTAGNILLKINSKLNGVNHIISEHKRPQCLNGAIIFGADVTHPSPDATEIPSIAAVAASVSSTDFFKYNVQIRLQPPREEIILDLKNIVYTQIKIYIQTNRKKPQKIFFYRDGVGEGYFAHVMNCELPAIQEVCNQIEAGYKPKITFLVVQKRHHTRFYPTDDRVSEDRNGNVPAGTIVDTQITHPTHIDFYLVSHASIQGTARPTKYRCLWDDNDMTEDDIEVLTYYLCHLFSRCNRSVSYPAPTYYAHLAAFRARALINGVQIQMDNLEREQLRKLTVKPELMSNNPMFFV